VWQELPYDEDLTGLEDIDWAVRAMRLGSRIAYEADAETIHVHNETSLQTFSRYRREAIAMKRIFPHEHFHFGHFVRLFLTNVSSDYRQAAHDRVLMSQWPGILRFRLMQFWGTYHGFASHAPVSNELKQTFYYPNRKRKTSSKLPVYKGKRPLVNYRSEERLRNENH
jgi:hypothetical protein